MRKIDICSLWTAHYRFVMAVLAEAAPAIGELGFEVKELFVLEQIDAHPHPAALAEVLVMPKPSVTVYLKRLEAAGFVKREIDPTDLRRHRLSLTPAGRKAMTKGSALVAEAFCKRLSRLSAAQQQQLGELVETLANDET